MNTKVCIIGAGSSGIATCKVFHQQNIPFDCYEKGSGIGGNWRYNNDNQVSSAYRSLHINTSRGVMAYSDYPMPNDYPDYPSHFQIIQYFESYMEHFGFKNKIKFGTSVEKIKKNEDNTFSVHLSNGQTEVYTHVIVANGHHWDCRYPEPAFAGNFTGTSFHSHYYKTPEVFADKNVLVVGFGNSGVDIACEASRNTTGKVFISTRSGAYILPKYIWGMPFDTLNKYSVDWLPMWLKRTLLNAFLWFARGKQESYGVPKPARKLLSEHPTISQDLLNLVGHGKLTIKPNIKKLAGDSVIFEDNTQEKIDVLVYATGYKISFPFFEKDFLTYTDNDIRLYQNVVSTEHQNLFFIGLVQPLGAVMPLAEVQSEWVAGIVKNEIRLPQKEQMLSKIDAYKEKMSKRYKKSARHTIQVEFYPYIQTIKNEMKKRV